MRPARLRRGAMVVASLGLLAVAVGWVVGPVSGGDVDYEKALVGTWEGRAEGPRHGSERTLLVRSVAASGGGSYAVDARFGTSGKGLARAEGTLRTGSGAPYLSLDTEAGAQLRVRLENERTLEGTVRLPRTGARQVDQPIRLKKVE